MSGNNLNYRVALRMKWHSEGVTWEDSDPVALQKPPGKTNTQMVKQFSVLFISLLSE